MNSDSTALVVAVIVMAAIGVLGFVLRPKRLKQSAAAQQLRATEASRRGWTFEVVRSGDEPACLYSGTTDSIPWRCEISARKVRGRGHGNWHQSATTRWSTDAAPPRDGLLIVSPSSGDAALIPAGLPPEMLARLAPVMNILGLDASDAPLLATALPVHDAALSARYRLQATDAELMQRFLDAGAREAFVDAEPWLVGSKAAHPMIVTTLGRRGVSIVLQGWVEDLDVVQRVAGLGVELARALGTR